MASVSLSQVINKSFITNFTKAAKSAAGQSTSLIPGSDTTSISSNLRLGARVYGNAVQALNGAAAYANLSEETLKKLGKLVDKTINIVSIASKTNISTQQRTVLNQEFQKIGAEFKKIVAEAKINSNEYINSEGLKEIFAQVGLDPEGASTLTSIFEKFVLANKDGKPLADDTIRGQRPIRLPPGILGQSTVRGDGGFEAFATVSLNGPSLDFVTGDFNQDGNLDIVSGGSGLVKLGDGNGNLTPGVDIGFDSTSTGLKSGDFNGDGFLDVLSYISGSSNFTVGYGNGDGTFAAPETISSSNPADSISTGDFNRDGITDVFLSFNGGTKFEFFLGTNDGLFQLTQTDALKSDTGKVVTGDFNGDGYLDVVSTDSGANTLTLYTYDNIAQQFIESTNSVASGLTDLLAVDINNDQKLDIVGLSSVADATIYLNDGLGNFSLGGTIAGSSGQTIGAVGDFNTDGYQDLALLQSGTTQVSVYNYSASGLRFNFSANHAIANSVLNGAQLATGDFNNDGGIDILALSADNSGFFNDSAINFLEGTGTTTGRFSNDNTEYESVFQSGRTVLTPPKAYRTLVDLKALRDQIKTNLSGLDEVKKAIEKNVKLVRAIGLTFLDYSDKTLSENNADQIASNIVGEIRLKAAGATSQAGNIPGITAAALLLG